jgi:hypothetical protein
MAISAIFVLDELEQDGPGFLPYDLQTVAQGTPGLSFKLT